MKLLFVSNLFPDATEPGRGLYHARLLRHLGELCEVRVISPRPALPLCRPKPPGACPEQARFAPQYPPGWYLPKIGSRLNPWLMSASLRGPLENLRRAWPFDFVLASWVYPDGCAVARLAERLGFPFGVVALGSDVHQYLENPVRRRIIVEALHRAKVVITVSGELSRLLSEAGVDPGKIRVIYNGVDTGVFFASNKLEARRKLGLPDDARVVLFVGHLLPIKNPLLALRAIKLLPLDPGHKAYLIMLGAGPLRPKILDMVKQLGPGREVVLPGQQSEREVALFMQAADVLCVPSLNEGVPNVLLEAFACGLPVVATRVGGIPEVHNADFLGRLVEPDNPVQLAEALQRTIESPAKPELLVQHARHFSWPETARRYYEALHAPA